MKFLLNEELTNYINARGRTVLNACPGSGKTSAVAYKLAGLVGEWNDSGGIACLSFTNIAKEEIQNKFKFFSGSPLSYPHLISTIDSFINRNITLPYINKVTNIARRFRIIDEEDAYLKAFGWDFKREYKVLYHKYNPYKISFIGVTKIFWNNIDMSENLEFVTYAKAAKNYQSKRGIITSSDSLYFALKILNAYPRLSKYLATRFSYIIVDEAQDTSTIHYQIFDSLINGGLKNFELIGDPYQCLYEWRDANPQSFLSRYKDNSLYQPLTFKQNKRSTQKIVDAYKNLRGEDSDLLSINNSISDLQIHVIKYKTSCKETLPIYFELCEKLMLRNIIVLVRGTSHLNEINGGGTAFKPWKSPIPYHLIQAKIKLKHGKVKEAMKLARKIFLSFLTEDYHKSKELEDSIKDDCEINADLFNFLRGIPDFDMSVNDWTSKSQLLIQQCFDISKDVDFEIKKAGIKKSDLEKLMSSFFDFMVIPNRLPVSTIHSVKGMTFESVLIVLGDKNHSEILTFNDLKSQKTTNEKQRMLYVGMSRPEKLLCLAVPESISNQSIQNVFKECKILT